MTARLYQLDSYLAEFEAVVVAADAARSAVALDRSAFYPGGGGQPHDLGTLICRSHPLAVMSVAAEQGLVWHWLSGGLPPTGDLPPVGAGVHGALDWDRRYRLMRTHTALHLLCGVVWRDFGAQVTGGNMQPLSARMDFEFESLTGDLVHVIEQRVNAEVAAQRAVRVAIVPREQAFAIPDLIRTKINLLPEGIAEVRTIEIVGLDLQADGGTHVANTREVGAVRVSGYQSKGRINKRIYIEIEP